LTKRRNDANLFLFIISCVVFLFGAFFIADIAGGFAATVRIFGVLSLFTGLSYLAYYSFLPLPAATQDWPMIQGLTDIILALALFVSQHTTKTDMIMYILAIWALTGFAARAVGALRMKGKGKKQAVFRACACLLSALLMCAATVFTSVPEPPVAGVGLIVYSFGSFPSFKQTFGNPARKS